MRFQNKKHNTSLVPTPGTARHVSCCFRGRRGTALRCASYDCIQPEVVLRGFPAVVGQ